MAFVLKAVLKADRPSALRESVGGYPDERSSVKMRGANKEGGSTVPWIEISPLMSWLHMQGPPCSRL